MTIRHTRNATSSSRRRFVRFQGTEVAQKNDIGVFLGENNPNLVDFNGVVGNPIFTKGFDYLPTNAEQWQANPV